MALTKTLGPLVAELPPRWEWRPNTATGLTAMLGVNHEIDWMLTGQEDVPELEALRQALRERARWLYAQYEKMQDAMRTRSAADSQRAAELVGQLS